MEVTNRVESSNPTGFDTSRNSSSVTPNGNAMANIPAAVTPTGNVRFNGERKKKSKAKVAIPLDPVKDWENLKDISCVLGISKIMDIERLSSLVYSNFPNCYSIIYLGGHMVMAKFHTSEDRDHFLRDNIATLEGLAMWKKAWNPQMTPLQRLVWISVAGVPIHAWSVNTFRRIASQWGEFVALDDRVNASLRFDLACMLVRIDKKVHVPNFVWVEVCGVKFRIELELIPHKETITEVDEDVELVADSGQSSSDSSIDTNSGKDMDEMDKPGSNTDESPSHSLAVSPASRLPSGTFELQPFPSARPLTSTPVQQTPSVGGSGNILELDSEARKE